MAKFSSDVDILKREPILFGELHLPLQVPASGTGATLAGTTLTALDVNFLNPGVSAGGVVYLRSANGVLDGAYEVVSVDSETQLTVSVLRSDVADDPIAPPAADNVTYRIVTYEPQAVDAAFDLTQYFGIQPGNPNSEITVDDVVDLEGLRRASAFAVISSVYATWAGRTDDNAFWQKSEHYGRLAEDARQRCHLSVDLGSDGVADITRVGGAIRLVRD
jgi:hypothetical protein